MINPFSPKPVVLTVDSILQDLTQKVQQLEEVRTINLNDSTRLEDESKQLLEESRKKKAEASRAANVIGKISALIS